MTASHLRDESSVAVVVIGRNEGDRLVRCLQSLPKGAEIVYVDSGSIDGSPQMAAKLGADVVELDRSIGFTAARGRNAGLARLTEKGSRSPYVQMLDGDSELAPGWIEVACEALRGDERLAGVLGRMRERHIEASIYNWLCDVEWAIPPGLTMAFGGGVMLRRSAVEVLRYSEDMIAAEDTEFSIRLRREGWRIRCLPAEMARHDAAILSFRQWWRRVIRGGHGAAELCARHFRSELHDFSRRCLRIVGWGIAWPIVAAASITMAVVDGGVWIWAAAGALLLILAQFIRIGIREWRHYPARKAFSLSFFLLVGKFAEAIGLLQYWLNRLTRRRSQLIEYKGAAASSADVAA